ncbi:Pet18p NDAI_0G04950 [Naumovozyma dairenensis CBS 421]|uniref:Thiaminase-2/PQQC domain-containing protein n=1 Tax=Naumovozyma dairenensis (strain ATCC 10597 / BCRC 20456 / CBS 421 / NBRC 0211 / NRRL Y-12639) TaxID=1071378 RepID=J7SB18_NAUDC|nr:hypothetical protein NDAI_0G04950 [Naumovozyma dairenensis CBS 421]CCK73478.1 hypothetical protein NDAI_0G04950 [Naumovozyma dairenensis CBS 421]
MPSTSETLLIKYQSIYKKATEHVFTKELCQGTLDDRSLYIYLAQDLQFFEVSLRLICKITSLAPDTDSLITLAKKIGFFANDENTYFRDCLELLAPSVSEEERKKFSTTIIPGIDKYVQLLEELKADHSLKYCELITFLWCLEQVYLKWAHDLPRKENLHWKYQTWIDLHDGEHFESWCTFLKNQVDKYPVEEVEEIFVKTTELEFEFFDSCYSA